MTVTRSSAPVLLAKIADGSEGEARAFTILLGCAVVILGVLLATNFKDITVRYQALGVRLRPSRPTASRWRPSTADLRVIGGALILLGGLLALGALLHGVGS